LTFALGPDHISAQLAASITFADAAAGPSAIDIYTSVQPTLGAAPGDTPQAIIVLAKPCATLVAGVLTLNAASPGGTLLLLTGIPRWARWRRSDDVLVADGTVTDLASTGDFRVSGGTTDPGESSPTLYAGGLVVLGAVTLT